MAVRTFAAVAVAAAVLAGSGVTAMNTDEYPPGREIRMWVEQIDWEIAPGQTTTVVVTSAG